MTQMEPICVIRAIRGSTQLPEKYGIVIKNFGIDKFLFERVFDGNVNDLGPAKRRHEPELLLPNQFNSLEPETSRQNPIVCCRRAAALGVAEDCSACFNPGPAFDLVMQPVADAAQLSMAKFVDLFAFGDDVIGLHRHGALSNHHNGELPSAVN